jgi:hypothetical protein
MDLKISWHCRSLVFRRISNAESAYVSICQHSHSKLFEISHWEGHRPFAFPADEDADEQLGSETLPQEVT